MTLRKILAYPEPILRVPAAPITEFNEDLSQLVVDMAETMYKAPGIGLAAPQIGESVQLIVVDVSREEDEQKFMVMVNPEIIAHQGDQVDEEGCLSVIDLTAMVRRYQTITVRYHDTAGREQEIHAENRFAVVLQHEIDHLHGILFIDHLSSLKRSLYKKKVKKMLAEQKGQA